jgi:hypothetical protein
MMVAVLGIDLAKRVFQLHVDHRGRFLVSRRVSRAKLAEAVVQLAPRVVVMEACCGAHYGGAGSAIGDLITRRRIPTNPDGEALTRPLTPKQKLAIDLLGGKTITPRSFSPAHRPTRRGAASTLQRRLEVVANQAGASRQRLQLQATSARQHRTVPLGRSDDS